MIGTDLEATADHVIDAAGKWVIPGGIDVHTHMELPFGGTFAKDTFETGTRAAAFGGPPPSSTSPCSHAAAHCAMAGRLRVRRPRARPASTRQPVIISDVRDDVLAEMDTLVEEGVTTFKLFTAYPGVFFSDDGAIFQAMQQTHKNGGLIMMHAENGLAIDVVAGQNFAVGNTDPLPRHQPLAGAGGEATNRVIRLAQVAEAPVYIVHLAARGAERGAPRPGRGPAGVRRDLPAVSVPLAGGPGQRLRGQQVRLLAAAAAADHQEDLWIGLLKDDLQVVSTDTARSTSTGRRRWGGDFRKVPEAARRRERMDLLHSGGVAEGRLTPNRWVEITSTAPARMFGLPQKGAVQVGLDADLVVYDPSRKHTISASTHHMDVDYSCYEGGRCRCADVVLSRGRIVVDGDEWVGEAGGGDS